MVSDLQKLEIIKFLACNQRQRQSVIILSRNIRSGTLKPERLVKYFLNSQTKDLLSFSLTATASFNFFHFFIHRILKVWQCNLNIYSNMCKAAWKY